MLLRFTSFITFFLSIFAHAQLAVANPLFVDAANESYHLQYGVSLCDDEKGNYEQAVEYLNSKSSEIDKEIKNRLQFLIKYKTAGKEQAMAILETCNMTVYQKELMKLWLFSVTHSKEDYTIQLDKLQKIYPEDQEILKIQFREILQDRLERIYTEHDFIELSKKMDLILSDRKLSESNRIYFTLIKFDFDYDQASESKTRVADRNSIAGAFAKLWKQNETFFFRNYAMINLKLKQNQAKEIFSSINEKIPDDTLFEPYLFTRYGFPIPEEAQKNNKKYIDFIATNPFYYGENEGGFNLGTVQWNHNPKKIETQADFQNFIQSLKNVIAQYPGAAGPKYTLLDAYTVNKDFFYKGKSEENLLDYSKTLIDLFALDQRADFENHFDSFRDILKHDAPSIKARDYPQIFFEPLKDKYGEELIQYVNSVRRFYPNNSNLHLFTQVLKKP